MPVSEPVTMVAGNLIADAAYPLLSETIAIDTPLYLGSVIAMDPATRVGALANAANQNNLFGVLRDHVMTAGSLAVVYVSGSFIRDTLKCADDTTIDALEPRLRELGIYCRASVRYPSDPALPPSPPAVP
jgi:hypothetical protein